jgi:hypothetical protein
VKKISAMDTPNQPVTGVYSLLLSVGLFILMKITTSDLAALAVILNASLAMVVNLPKVIAVIERWKTMFRKK